MVPVCSATESFVHKKEHGQAISTFGNALIDRPMSSINIVRGNVGPGK
jgi:hypothetical protein